MLKFLHVSFKVRHFCAQLWSATTLLQFPFQQFSLVLRFNVSSSDILFPSLCIWTSYCVYEMYCSYFVLQFIYHTTLWKVFRVLLLRIYSNHFSLSLSLPTLYLSSAFTSHLTSPYSCLCYCDNVKCTVPISSYNLYITRPCERFFSGNAVENLQ